MRTVSLPVPQHQGSISLDSTLWARRSTREFSDRTISLADASQLLWAAQGVNRPDGHRTAPSAGATYPLELYLLAARVDGLEPGMYRYRPATHDLVTTGVTVRLVDLPGVAVRQEWVTGAAALVVFAAAYERTSGRYASRAERYVPMEVGHAAQNLYLEAAALGLGTTFIGAFTDSALARVLALPAEQRPLGLMPVGHPR
jgi:SagB-type dehydrogenase family enzyme